MSESIVDVGVCQMDAQKAALERQIEASAATLAKQTQYLEALRVIMPYCSSL